MGHIVLIDGYNVIGSEGRFRRDRDVLARERENLVRRLSEYRSLLDPDTEIHLIFDGFPSDREPFRRPGGGVTVLFSEEEGSADAVIVRLSERYGSRAIVVTSDREVIRRAQASGAQAVGAREFLGRVGLRRAAAAPHVFRGEKPEDEEDDNPRQPAKKGNPRRLSKKERARRRTLLNL
ncbi:MAG: NYN domain-containing protein [Nitrospirae bacterium]|jgi:hypothetical protein|nr:NYN domain-containing protein [Nitrospirota bacterium]